MPVDALKNCHVLVLGGSSGMGYAVASYLLQSGAIVTIGARTPAKLTAARERMLGETGADADRLRAMPADARDSDAVEAIVAHAASPSGELDGVFVVAGGGDFMPVVETTTAFAADQFATNMFPMVNAIRSCVPRMKRSGGSIVALSSTAAVCSYPRLAAYGAAKAALDFYVQVAADELGEFNIRVNAVRSGFTKSDAAAELIEDAEYVRKFSAITPLGPYAQPEQFGPMVALLMSSDTSWITGQVFSIDGGLSLRGYGGGIFPTT